MKRHKLKLQVYDPSSPNCGHLQHYQPIAEGTYATLKYNLKWHLGFKSSICYLNHYLHGQWNHTHIWYSFVQPYTCTTLFSRRQAQLFSQPIIKMKLHVFTCHTTMNSSDKCTSLQIKPLVQKQISHPEENNFDRLCQHFWNWDVRNERRIWKIVNGLRSRHLLHK